jgi:hypothetical protein
MLGLLIIVVGVIGYLAFVVWFPWWMAKRTRNAAVRAVVYVVSLVALLAAPWVDEIVGKFQFDRLCEEAKDVKVYATIPVGEVLYFADGRWRLSSSPPLSRDEFNRAQSIYESMVRFESNELSISSSPMPIYGHETRIFNRKTGQLLALFQVYGTPGGWISRSFEKPTFVRDQCLPQSFSKLGELILPFDKR